jgi:oligopeptide/dipeptide ABC transporter ATP-binding protein
LTRDPSIAAVVAERVAILHAARLVEEGCTAAVLGRPAHPYTRSFVDALPLAGTRGTRLRTVPGAPPRPHALPSGCAFRARCAFAIDACVARPDLRPIGPSDERRAIRCHNPLPLARVQG